MNRNLFASICLSLFCFSSVVAEETQTVTPPVSQKSVEVVIEKDVTYGKGGETDLKLDIVRPVGEGPFPALLFIHGGGWKGGNRQSYSSILLEAAARGYVAATVTYRLTDPDENNQPRHPFPAAVHDVKCAVRWLRANAKQWHIDPERIGAIGGSAGGHLSLMVGLTDPKSKLDGDGGHADQSSRVQAVVNYFGPTDMLEGYKTTVGGKQLMTWFMDGTPEEQPENYKNASPVTWISADDPPVLTFHGGQDTLVPPAQAHLLDEAMKKAGVPHTLVIYESEGHGFKAEFMLDSIVKSFEFFDEHLKTK